MRAQPVTGAQTGSYNSLASVAWTLENCRMGCLRVLLCILLPPLAVLDFGCGSIVIVSILTLCGWVPGALAALVVCSQHSGNRH